MKLIRSVEIERFRSLERVELGDLSDMVALVGPNNSGKSNVLRALSLFFNDEVEPATFLDFETDYYLLAPAGKQKRIRLAVEFDLPPSFRFRADLKPAEGFLGRRFMLRKTWTLKSFEPVIEYSAGSGGHFKRVEAENADKVRQFLDLISFRYIPNRAVPAEVIREESRAIQRELARRVATYAKAEIDKDLRESLQKTAARMVEPVVAEIREWCPGLEKVELATPEGLAAMLAPSIFRAVIGPTAKVKDTALGAGVQALLMFQVLHKLVDSSEFRGFGWKQAAVWAIEEPESSLHRDQQLRLASLLRSYAEKEARFQVLYTTHCEVFIYSATSGFAVTQEESKTVARSRRISELADEAAGGMVSGWTAPALKFPLDTLVLVEGQTDRRVLSHAAQLTGASGDSLRFCVPSQLDPSLGSDGVDQIIAFLKLHRGELRQRLRSHPLLILVDWEVSDSNLQTLLRKYGDCASLCVKRMEEAWADPRIGQSFRGIERFFSARILEAAEAQGIISLARGGAGELVVMDKKKFEAAKSRLAELFVAEASVSDCVALAEALKWASATWGGEVG
jgi:energy-coupling factor transporter ATP-binding protein EcfA2